jgi:hypothetical protein
VSAGSAANQILLSFAPNAKSSNPVFDDGMMIEEKTADVHEKVSDATRLLFTGI